MNLRTPTTLTPALALCFLLACNGDQSATSTQTKPVQPDGQDKVVEVPKDALGAVQKDKKWQDHAKTPTKVVSPVEIEPEEDRRLRRRVDIDQLEASIKQVSGGIGWTEQRGSTEVNVFEELSATLGKPDYINSTQEDLEPSLIFQKFLGDASRHVCDKLVDREFSTYSITSNRNLLIHAGPEDTLKSAPEKIEKNLGELLLRFHGTFVEDPNNAPQLQSWRWLFESAMHVGGDTKMAWRTVCVGLMTHSDFYTY